MIVKGIWNPKKKRVSGVSSGSAYDVRCGVGAHVKIAYSVYFFLRPIFHGTLEALSDRVHLMCQKLFSASSNLLSLLEGRFPFWTHNNMHFALWHVFVTVVAIPFQYLLLWSLRTMKEHVVLLWQFIFVDSCGNLCDSPLHNLDEVRFRSSLPRIRRRLSR